LNCQMIRCDPNAEVTPRAARRILLASGGEQRHHAGMKAQSLGRAGLWKAVLAGLLFLASLAAAAERVGRYLNRPDDWLSQPEARRVAANILSHQSDLGGWPKNTDTAGRPHAGDRQSIKPTFDNGATTDELRFLARMYQAAKEEPYRRAFERGYDYVLKAQYPSGGWPQSYPPGPHYPRHITFNDNAMVRLMEFLRETWQSDRYSFLSSARRAAARAAFQRGVACILKCQIRTNGKLTGWCAQHDELDYTPRAARSYELVSISGAESVGIVQLLMSLDQPTPEVRGAVEAALAWFEVSRVEGIKIVEQKDEKAPRGKNKVVLPEDAAPPLWARFYEIGSNRPMFSDRDGVVKYSLAEIGYERRNGYAWYGDWPGQLLEKAYPAWSKQWGLQRLTD
jgi:PelA/Pel-15E family pectate lyase